MNTLSKLKQARNKGYENEKKKYEASLKEKISFELKNTDESQLAVIVDENPKILVEGPAGSGKTLIALNKIGNLYSEGKTFKLVVYTMALKEYLIAKLESIGILDAKELVLYYDEFKKENIGKNVDYLIIDEAQDFEMDNMRTCLKICREGYYIFGDDGQQIYPENTKGEKIIKKIKEELNVNIFTLQTTHRLPKKLALYCENIKNEKEDLSSKCYEEGIVDNIPVVVECKNVEKEFDYIAEVLNNNKEWTNIGILVRRNARVSSTFDKLNKRGILCDYKDGNNVDNLSFSNDRPKILTYHSAKGLEFEHVFIPECDVFEDLDTAQKIYNYREALYVATTRSKNTLVISYSDEKSPYLEGINKEFYIFKNLK